MHVRFADVDESFIEEAVRSGFYANATELVRDAVRRLREQNAVNSPFYQAVMEGVRDIESGRTRPLTPALMRSLKKKGYQDADEA
ncbi:MAG: type II toxin-antitoxin system ParD family antitoxin [Holosporales bacterium]|jgi:antitoxin ParD1/3/4